VANLCPSCWQIFVQVAGKFWHRFAKNFENEKTILYVLPKVLLNKAFLPKWTSSRIWIKIMSKVGTKMATNFEPKWSPTLNQNGREFELKWVPNWSKMMSKFVRIR